MRPMETTKRYYRVDSREISFLRFVLEGYDNLAILTTLDAGIGHVALAISPGCEQDAMQLVRDLQKEMLIEPAPAPDMRPPKNGENNSGRYDGTKILY